MEIQHTDFYILYACPIYGPHRIALYPFNVHNLAVNIAIGLFYIKRCILLTQDHSIPVVEEGILGKFFVVATFYAKFPYFCTEIVLNMGCFIRTGLEVTVTGQSYSKYSGYGTLMGNNYITSDTYRFADTLGNSMDYTVSYQLKNSDGFYYVTDLQVKGCETSNVREYGNLCGPTSPTKTITNLSPDTSVSLFDANKTYILIGVLALIGCIPVYAIIM